MDSRTLDGFDNHVRAELVALRDKANRDGGLSARALVAFSDKLWGMISLTVALSGVDFYRLAPRDGHWFAVMAEEVFGKDGTAWVDTFWALDFYLVYGHDGF